MKIARFRSDDGIAYGILDQSADGSTLELIELAADPIVSGFDTTGRRIPVSDVTLLAPVIPSSKIVCVGKNYLDHIEEMRDVTGGGRTEPPTEPLLFLKPNTAVIGPDDEIVLPTISERVEHEGELAVIIGQIAKDVPAERALDVVFGYTCANDVTARDLQVRDGQWSRAKGFDTFCPLGPVIETELDLTDAALETRVNGEVRQRTTTALLIHSIATIIAHASQVFTLLPGDVILTGTPAGVGPLRSGDTVEVDIVGIGILRNRVA